jgi:hypothetical protein
MRILAHSREYTMPSPVNGDTVPIDSPGPTINWGVPSARLYQVRPCPVPLEEKERETLDYLLSRKGKGGPRLRDRWRFFRNARRSGIGLPMLEAFRRIGSLSRWVEGGDRINKGKTPRPTKIRCPESIPGAGFFRKNTEGL